MFPIPWNFPFRKKDGSLSTIGTEISGGGGGSELPPHTIADAGKVLMVDSDNTLMWGTVSSGVNQFEFAPTVKPTNDIESKANKGGI